MGPSPSPGRTPLPGRTSPRPLCSLGGALSAARTACPPLPHCPPPRVAPARPRGNDPAPTKERNMAAESVINDDRPHPPISTPPADGGDTAAWAPVFSSDALLHR